jgi:CubicO group peptidase (beta-lactamase class C family)
MRQTLFALVFFSLAQNAFAQATDTVAQIDKLFSSWNNATPGGSVLVARGKTVLYQKAFGLANLEHTVPNTINTIFEAGSVSKQFTAYSILLLEDEGKLKLTDDIRKYIPELPLYEAPITIQMLLNHTSGLKDWGSVGALTGWPRGQRNYTLELALQIITKQKTTNYKPGAEYNYSNTNFTLQVVIVERVSKQKLEDFTKEKIFGPLGMTSTSWRSDFRRLIPHRASAYSPAGEGKYQLDIFFENVYGHGGLLTTTTDLLKWNQLLENHNAIYFKRVERGKLNNGKAISYAAGIQHGEVSGIAEIGHSGSTGGYRAWLAYYPSKKITITILSNDASFGPVGVGHQIAELYFGPPKEIKQKARKSISLTEAEVSKWPGIYKSIREFDVFTLGFEGQNVLNNGHALKAAHADTLYNEDRTWIYRKNGTVTTVNNYGDTASYRQVSIFAPRSVLTGDYFSDESESGFSVTLNDNKLYLVNKPFEPQEMVFAFADAFIVEGELLVEFKRNSQGQISGFDISVPRAERISFKKIK